MDDKIGILELPDLQVVGPLDGTAQPDGSEEDFNAAFIYLGM